MLYIIVEEHSGILLSIYRCLTGEGYNISSNQYGKRASDGKAFIKLAIDQGDLPLPPQIESQLLNVEGCIDILYDEPLTESTAEKPAGQQAAGNDTQLKTEVAKVSKEIINNFSNIANIVFAFSQRHQGAELPRSLYYLGFEVGKVVYQNDYALGKPLNLELTLKRMLADALRDFGKISCNQRLLSIDDNVFCNVANPHGHCDFTRGFMTGFLHSSPTTKEVRADNISCRSHGQSTCSFEFQ